MARWAFLGVAVAIVGAVFALRQLTDVTVRIPYGDRAAVAEGAAVYAEHCARCHGANLEGQAGWPERGADGRLPASPLDETGVAWRRTDQQLFEISKFGPAAFTSAGYQTDMPAYENVLSDQEILSVLAYAKASWPRSIQAEHDQMPATPQ